MHRPLPEPTPSPARFSDVLRASPERGPRARLAAVLRQRCPLCLHGRVFRPAFPWWQAFRMYYACTECRVVYGRENGYFTGAMIVSYVLGVPLVFLLYLLLWLVTGWDFDTLFVLTGLYFLPFIPAIYRYSRVIWMHFDRLMDRDPENERFLPQASALRQAPLAR